MEKQKVFLKGANERPGEFECSICGELFRPMPKKPSALTDTFNAHVREKHPETLTKDNRESAKKVTEK
jgi:hypothetical protein